MMAIGFTWFVFLARTFAQLDLWVSLVLFALFCLWSAVPFGLWAALVREAAGPEQRRQTVQPQHPVVVAEVAA